jgi:hypothetical protein
MYHTHSRSIWSALLIHHLIVVDCSFAADKKGMTNVHIEETPNKKKDNQNIFFKVCQLQLCCGQKGMINVHIVETPNTKRKL